MIGCGCGHYPDYHRRLMYAADWHCTACTACGKGRPMHTNYVLRDSSPRTSDRHEFQACNCTGSNTDD